MAEDIDDKKLEETEEKEEKDEKEEVEEKEETDNKYVNDDEVEMLRSIEKRFNALEEKIDNMISMYVDSGAIVQSSIDYDDNDERNDDDFLSIDELDLTL